MTFYVAIRELEEMINMHLPEKNIASKKDIIKNTYPAQFILYEKSEDIKRHCEQVLTRLSSLSYLIVIPRPLMPPPITIDDAIEQGDKYKEVKGENKKYSRMLVDALQDFEKKYPEDYIKFIRSPPFYKGYPYQDLSNTIRIKSCYNAIFLRILKDYDAKVVETLKQTLVPVKKPRANPVKPSKPRAKEPIVKAEKKKSIPSAIKKLVWNKNIGEEIGKSKCYCCKSTDITQTSFHCGHVVAESKGGKTIVSNLKPICQNCNSSMGTKDMNEFMSTLL